MKLAYCRISTREQAESLDNQEQTLIAHGCARVYKDIASGTKTSRPGLQEALSYARPGDSIVVTRLDRLGRSTVDILHTVQDLDQRGITIEALDTQLDTQTPSGRLVLSVLASMAEFERNLIVERTREGLAHARAQGRIGGRPPKLSQDQKQAALGSLATGMSIAQVAAAFGVSRSTIARLKATQNKS